MKINSAILSQQVSNKLTNACISSIVSKAMINALPLTAENVATESGTLTKYTTRVIKSLHGEALLKNALESMKGSPNGLTYLLELQDCIVPVVESATKRIVKENKDALPEDLQNVVDKAAFTKDEMNTFATKGKSLDLNTISEIVKDKVVKTLKNEKEAFEFSKKLENDINDAIADVDEMECPDTPDEAEEIKKPKKTAVESMMDIILQKSDPRRPISFFSRLQDVSMETLLAMKPFEGEISLDALCAVTMNQTIDSFTHWAIDADSALENMLDYAATPKESVENAGDKSLIMAIIILTTMETLKTMRLLNITPSQIKTFVDRPTEPGVSYNGQSIADQFNTLIQKANALLRTPNYNVTELGYTLETFGKLKEKLAKIDSGFLPEKDTLLKGIEATITKIDGVMAKATESTGMTSGTGYFAKRNHEQNIAALDRVYRTISRRKDVSKIVFEMDSSATIASESTVVSIPVKAIGTDGLTVVERYPLYMNVCEALGSIPEELFSAANHSKIKDIGDMCKVYFTNTCYSIPLVNEDSI